MLAALHTHPQLPDRATLARMTHALIVLPSADAIPADCPERPLLLATLARRRLAAGDLGIKVFFLSCVLIAGLYGAASASRKILFVQALPAALGLGLVLLA